MRIGKLFGIDIVIHVSWIFVFALVAWSLASDMGPLQHIQATAPERAFIAIITAALFFASVLVHELAHSLLAKARGINVSRITLFIFGGVSSLDGDASTAGAEGWIAFVGPLTSLVLGLLFTALAQVLGAKTPSGGAAAYLGYANIALAIFNIVPAYPLDGGRVFRALVWSATGDKMRATRIAATVGRTIAYVMIAFGIFESLEIGFGQGLWIVFIGWFLLQAGGTEVSHLELISVLKGKTALDLAASVPPPIPANASLRTAADLLVQSERVVAPVMLGEVFLGLVSLTAVQRAIDSGAADTPVTAIMLRATNLTLVQTSAPATDVLRMLGDGAQSALIVVDSSGALAGLITRDSLMHRLSLLAR